MYSISSFQVLFLFFYVQRYFFVLFNFLQLVFVSTLIKDVKLDLENNNTVSTLSNVWHTGIPGLWTQELDAGLWTLDSGRWTLEAGLWTLDSARWTLHAGLWTLHAKL